MKANACPRCLAILETIDPEDSGTHTCNPTDFARSLENRIDVTECLTAGIDWKEWYDCAEILASQEVWKRTAESYAEVVNLVWTANMLMNPIIWRDMIRERARVALNIPKP